ncbi:MAG TPA: catalase family protein [Aldersonia sp.]
MSTSIGGTPLADLPYVRYAADLEREDDHEAEMIERIVAALHRNNKSQYNKRKHAIRDAHAKGHGALIGRLVVEDGLPQHLRQGLFAAPGRYPVIARFSSTAGAIRSDRVQGVRAIAFRVFDVPRNPASGDGDTTFQDVLLSNHETFFFPDVRKYRRNMWLAWLLSAMPDWMVTGGVVPFAKAMIRVAALRDKPASHMFEVLARPNTHILSDTFHSASAYRFGDYVARFSLAPASPTLRALAGHPTGGRGGHDALRDQIADYVKDGSARFSLRAQLCTNPWTMPVEDAAKNWPSDESPPQHVATLVFPTQDSCDLARSAYVDEAMSFNPWNHIEEHRPLGSINRVKKRAYEESSRFRHTRNRVQPAEPCRIDDVPASTGWDDDE